MLRNLNLTSFVFANLHHQYHHHKKKQALRINTVHEEVDAGSLKPRFKQLNCVHSGSSLKGLNGDDGLNRSELFFCAESHVLPQVELFNLKESLIKFKSRWDK